MRLDGISPFLKTGTICASIQSCVTVPWSWENLYNLVNTCVSSSAGILGIVAEMLFGRAAFQVFSWESCLCTHLVLNKILTIDGYGLGPL